MRRGQWQGHSGVWWLWAVGFILPAGCGPRAEIVLHQPFAPPSQQHLQLAGDRTYFATEGNQQVWAATFSLPGAADGPRAFVLYACGPDAPGRLPVAPLEPTAVSGFVIQEVGALAGRSDFLRGTVTCHDVWLAPNLRRVDFDVWCEDGVHLTGRAVARRDPARVRTLEREFAGDVLLVRHATAQPAGAIGTGPRGRGDAAPGAGSSTPQ